MFPGPRFIPILLVLTFGTARGEQPQLRSDQPIEFDGWSQTLRARGNANFRHQGLEVSADEIKWIRPHNRSTANGDVLVSFRDFRLVGRELVYEFETGKLTSEAFRLGRSPLYASGSSVHGNFELLTTAKATLYLQEPSPFAINLNAVSLDLIEGNRIQAEKVTFRIGKLPFFYLPKVAHPIDRRVVELGGQIGFRDNLGAFVQSETLLPFVYSWRLGMNLDAYSKRGILFGPAASMQKGGSEKGVVSRLETGFICDTGDRGFDLLGNPIEEDRWLVAFRHRQIINPRLSIAAAIDAWSDSEVLRDFRSELFRSNQNPDNYVEATYREGGIFVSAITRLAPNDFQTVVERLPAVRIDVMPQAVGDTGFYHAFNASFVRLRRDGHGGAGLDGLRPRGETAAAPGTLEDLASDRIMFYYSVQRPLPISKWMQLTPRAGIEMLSYFNQSISGSLPSVDQELCSGVCARRSHLPNRMRVIGEIGADLELKAYGVWNITNSLWGIDGLRHLLRPIVQYRHRFNDEQNPFEVVRIDRMAFSTSLPPIDLGNIRFIDEPLNTNILRIGVENLLQTRHEEYGARDLVTLHLYQDIILEDGPGERPWSGFHTLLALKPTHWLRFALNSHFDPSEMSLRQLRTRVAVADGDIWSLTFDTNHLQAQIDQYSIGFFYRFNERWSFTGELCIDNHRKDITEQYYGFRHHLANTWEIEYGAYLRQGNSREGDAGFRVRVRLLTY